MALMTKMRWERAREKSRQSFGVYSWPSRRGSSPPTGKISVRSIEEMQRIFSQKPEEKPFGVSYIYVGGAVVGVGISISQSPDIVCSSQREALHLLDELRAEMANDNEQRREAA
jgi:hypothetical protein